MSAAAQPKGARKGALGAWVVQCFDYTTPPKATREAAERVRADIERQGDCRNDHVVMEVVG